MTIDLKLNQQEKIESIKLLKDVLVPNKQPVGVYGKVEELVYSKSERKSKRNFRNSNLRVFINKMSEIDEEETNSPQTQQVLKDTLVSSDYFEESPKTPNTWKTFPKIHRGLGAEAFWTKLQNRSLKRVLKIEENIPEELKKSYGAFIRQNISRKRPIIFRSFTQHQDVPEIDLLLDKRYEARVRRSRHHANVMFKASENNKERTHAILNRNKILKDESLHKFFSHLEDPKTPSTSASSNSLPKSQIQRSAKNNNLYFLSEDRLCSSGSFRDRFNKNDEVKQVSSVPGFNSRLPTSLSIISPCKARCTVSEPRLPLAGAREPIWKPLTVGSLLNYSPSRKVSGFGRFRFGGVPKWNQDQFL